MQQRLNGEQLRQRDLDTIKIVEDLLSEEQVDIRELRKVSAVRGLVTSSLRARVWPRLLHVDLTQLPTYEEYHALSAAENEFRAIISADVHRSLYHYFDEDQELQRQRQRIKLERVLNAVVNFHEGNVHYYQGLHDIASVLLLTLGESLAFAVLCELTTIRLRDCTQSTLEPVAELLKLQIPILRKLDPSLAKHLENMKIPCYFAISWFITWFSHDVPHFHEVCRLFDFFLATHPLMPLYAGAVSMHAARAELLEAKEMSELHKSLVNLRVIHYLTVDEIILQAISLYHRDPPRRVVRDLIFHLNHCVTPFASLENDQWKVPSKPPLYQFRKPHKWIMHTLLGGMVANGGLSGASVRMFSMAGFGICAVAVIALKLMESDLDQVHKSIWDGMFNQQQ